MSFFKKPGEPVGNGDREVWARNLLRWAAQFELKSCNGGRIIPDANGGYSLVIDGSRGGGVTDTMFPFKIMLSPPNPAFTGTPTEIAAEHAAKDWRTFRVRSGFVGLQEIAAANSTDGVAYPDTDPPPIFKAAVPNSSGTLGLDGKPTVAGGYDFLVRANKGPVFVWIDVTNAPTTAPLIYMSDIAPVAGWTFSAGWDSGKRILLGWIDTATGYDVGTGGGIAYVRQLVRADLPEYFVTEVCIGGVWKTIRLPARIVA